VDIGGELDIAAADLAARHVRQVIDRHHGPVIADLARWVSAMPVAWAPCCV
jgi:hypothetical protein